LENHPVGLPADHVSKPALGICASAETANNSMMQTISIDLFICTSLGDDA
jgi:hypothetical protein